MPLHLKQPEPFSRPQLLALWITLALSCAARFIALDRVPPGLWYDEALYSMDGYGVSRGNLAIFFAEGGHPREPLFPWLLGAAFALFEPTVLVARCVSALCGSLAVALFFPVARRFMSNPWALAATAAFGVFRWHIHFSRTIFRAGLASLLMLLVVWLFLRWRERRRPMDAALLGAALGGCLYTYISLRAAPVLVGLWITWAVLCRKTTFREIRGQVALIFGTMLLVFLPLGVDYLRHPDHLSGRTGEISMFDPAVEGSGWGGIARNAVQVAGAWFVKGDHVAKHNIPYRPVFDPVTGVLFAVGLGYCAWSLVRGRSLVGLILVSWFGAFALASVFSYGAPNILRMQGASPAVILLMVLGLQLAWQAWPVGRLDSVRKLAPGLVLGFFAVSQLVDYFYVFPRDARVRQEFTADIFYKPASAADALATEVDKVYVPEELMQSLQVRFTTIRRSNVVTYGPADHPQKPPPGQRLGYLVTARAVELASDQGVDLEGELHGMPGARVVERFAIPIPGENGEVARRQPWAQLWVSGQ